MKYLRYLFLLLFFTIVLLSMLSCNDGFESVTLQIADVNLKKAEISSSYAYFLSEDGVLYCSGADTDASAFVVYQNKRDGVVARDVVSFGTMVNGGYYITENSDLYIYNKDKLEMFGYTKSKTHSKVLTGALDACFGKRFLVWLDRNSSLRLVGKFQGEQYSLESPLLIGKEVAFFACQDGNLLWVDLNGNLHAEGEFSKQALEILSAFSRENPIEKIKLAKGYIAFLSNQELWFFGDPAFWEDGETNHEENGVLNKLADDIVDFDCSARTLGAKTKDGEFLLWGRCIANDEQETDVPSYEFFEKEGIARQVKSIFVCDSYAGYIHENGTSHIFHGNLGRSSFYGNSTDADVVGIRNTPRTWI